MVQRWLMATDTRDFGMILEQDCIHDVNWGKYKSSRLTFEDVAQDDWKCSKGVVDHAGPRSQAGLIKLAYDLTLRWQVFPDR